MSEIADTALSPGINDPGAAINVIGTMVQLITLWQSPLEEGWLLAITYDRVSVPKLMIGAAWTKNLRDEMLKTKQCWMPHSGTC